MFDFLTNPSLLRIDSFYKIGLLLLVGIYIIFAFMLLSKVRSFKRIITLSPRSGMLFIQGFTYLFLILLLFLFVFVLVIV